VLLHVGNNKQSYDECHILTAILFNAAALVGSGESIKFNDLRLQYVDGATIKKSYFENKVVLLMPSQHSQPTSMHSDDDKEEKQHANDADKSDDELLQKATQLLVNTTNCSLRVHRLHCSLTAFRNKYPFLCTSSSDESSAAAMSLNAYPNEVLDGKLWIGDSEHAASDRVIKDLQITHVVNATENVRNFFEKSKRVTYYRVAVDDAVDEQVHKYFAESNKFIDEAIQSSHGRVLVHCMMGVSRSSTIVIAYLMYKNRWDFDTAYDYVKRRRSCIWPNQSFQEQLKKFEETILTNSVNNNTKQ